MCSNEHNCNFKCEKLGICSITYTPETRKWNDGISETEYTYIRPDKT